MTSPTSTRALVTGSTQCSGSSPITVLHATSTSNAGPPPTFSTTTGPLSLPDRLAAFRIFQDTEPRSRNKATTPTTATTAVTTCATTDTQSLTPMTAAYEGVAA